MAFLHTLTFLLIITFLILLTPLPTSSQSPAPAPGPGAAPLDCTTYLLNMSDCLSYVEAGSNLTVPESACCPELAGMVGTKPVCLCQLLGSADSFGIEISLEKAMELPSVCKVSTPPVSTFCAAAGYPIGAASPIQPPTSHDDNPTAGGDKSGAPSIISSQLLGFAGIAAATLLTFFWF